MGEKKTSPMTIIILVVVLAGLGFSVMFMLKSTAQTNKRARAAQARAEKRATDMPVVPTTSGSKVDKGEAVLESAEKSNLNPNQFKVFALNPQKNPFLAKEEWYEDDLQQIKGYPGLKETDYFNNSNLTLPDIDLIYDDPSRWESISLQRTTQTDNFEISGTSDDGMTAKTIQLTQKAVPDDSVEWTARSGVPLSALRVPGWETLYAAQLMAAEKAEPEPEIVPGAVDDLFGGAPPPGGLDIPGSSVDELRGEGGGDAVAVYGISRKGKRASALVQYSGGSYMLTEGSSLPPRFKVKEIKADGVLLIEVKDGSSFWVPLQARPAAATKRTSTDT